MQGHYGSDACVKGSIRKPQKCCHFFFRVPTFTFSKLKSIRTEFAILVWFRHLGVVAVVKLVLAVVLVLIVVQNVELAVVWNVLCI